MRVGLLKFLRGVFGVAEAMSIEVYRGRWFVCIINMFVGVFVVVVGSMGIVVCVKVGVIS